jgi:hypothetical protein
MNQPAGTKARFEEWFETSVIHPIEEFQDPKQEYMATAAARRRSFPSP